MTRLGRFVLAALCALIIAAMVHIGAVLALPWLSERDALSRLRSTAVADQSELIAAPGGAETWLPSPDPAVAVGACAYNLAEGPLRVSARTAGLFQSLSFHARGGGAFFAVTDRAAVRNALDLVILTRAQLDEALAGEDPEDPSRDVRIVAPQREGFMIVRVLAALPSQRAEAEALAKSVSCTVDPASDAS